MKTSTKYNQYAVRISKGMGVRVRWAGVVGSLSFDVQGRGVLPNSNLFGETEKGGRGKVQKLDIFHGCH